MKRINNYKLESESEDKFFCLECGKESPFITDILLCENCMDLFDTGKLWELHDKNELDALDFNESKKMRERFRK